MKRLKSLALTFLFLALIIEAQKINYSKPQMVDEFGLLSISDIKARLDAAVYAVQLSPKSRLIIIGYRGKNETIGKTLRNFRMMRTYLSQLRKLDPNRISIIDGGENRLGFRFQLWVSPEEIMPEIFKPESNYLEDTSIARKFDEYYYAFEDLDYEYWSGDNFDEYITFVKKEPNTIAYVILYPEYSSYGDENGKPTIRRDSLRKINRIKADIIKKLTKKNKLPLSRIKLINGGYRDNRFVELWILPKGVEPPAATPNAFPKTQRKSGKR